MSTQSEIAATREEISAVRDRMSDTVAAIEAQVSERVDSVKERLDVMQVVRDHPWPALAVALGAGIAIAATGADRKAASATADASRSAAKASADAVKSGVRAVKSKVQGGETDTSQPADHSPSRTHGMIVGALDSLAAKLATSLIERLREPEPLRATPEPEGLGYTDNTTPAQGVDSPSA